MISRLKKLVWSLGIPLSMGVAFVPLGCESSGSYTSVLPRHRVPEQPELPEAVVEELSACVKQGPAPSTSAEGDPPVYVILFDVHMEGGVRSVDVRESMLGGGGMEACMASVLRGARLPMRAQATQRAPQAGALVASPALALAPAVSLAPVALTGIGILVLVAVTVYVVTDKDSDEDERERCRKVNEACQATCGEELGKPGFGNRYHKCMKDCREAAGCWKGIY